MKKLRKVKIGSYNPEASDQKSLFYRDENNLMLSYTPKQGMGDCIGRTMQFYLIYNDEDLIEGLDFLWNIAPYKNHNVTIERHPDLGLSRKMSRDHYIHSLVALKIFQKRTNLTSFYLQLLSSKGTKVLDKRHIMRIVGSLKYWTKALGGNKRALWMYLMLELITQKLFYLPLWKLGTKLAGWGEEVDCKDWMPTYLQNQPKWKQLIDKIIFPSYALLYSGFQLYVTDDTFPKLKEKVKKNYLKMVGKTNYVQRMLFGDKVPRDKVLAYRSMNKSRWSGYLNGRNDRAIYKFPKGSYTENLIDVDLVRWLYNETQL